MCDQNALGIAIFAAELSISAAMVLLAVAINQGKSILTAFQSMSTSDTIAVLIGAAAVSLGIAAAVASGCKSGPCSSQAGDVENALIGTTVALAAATVLVLVSAHIPGAVNVAGPLTLIILLGAAGGFAYLGVLLAALATCFVVAAITLSTWLVLATGIAFFTAGLIAIVAIYGIVLTIQTAIEEASG